MTQDVFANEPAYKHSLRSPRAALIASALWHGHNEIHRLSGAALTETLGNPGRVDPTTMDCWIALEKMQATLAGERNHRRHLEATLAEAQRALAQTRADLLGTQAGERHARHLALHDSLTSLPNRGFFSERLQAALAEAEVEPSPRGLAVFFLDLDDFKPVNDTHGHAVGDELLRVVGARLSRAVRADDMVSRLGGDEFACLLGGLSTRDQVGHLAGKVLDMVAAPCQIGTLRLAIRPSIGIAMYPCDGVSAPELIEHADAAMYSAKRQQTGYAFFDEHAESWAAQSIASWSRQLA